MDCEFDCPQYYDFENQFEESHPEEYFETRQTRSAFTPYKNILTPIGNVKNKGFIPSLGIFPSLSNDGGPCQNTRSCLRDSMNSERAVKKVSSRFQPLKETSTKKAKKTVTVEEDDKVPLPVVNKKRWATGRQALKRLRKLKSKQPKRMSLTVPEPFSFLTDKRLKGEVPEKSEYKTVDFVTTLRSNKENEHYKVPTGPVRAVPERLLRKRKMENSKTMAEQVLSFQTELAHRERPESPPDSRSAKCPRVTRPVTPLLRAATRNRPLHILTQEEKEILEAEEMKKYRFKALPANRKMLIPVGIKKKFGKKPQSVKKSVLVKPRSRSLDRPPEFHARPVPLKILQGVTGLGKRNPVESTEPHSPSFALKKREEIWKRHEEDLKRREAAEAAALEEARSKAPRRHLRSHSQSLSSSPKDLLPKKTVPAPFSFHTRNQKMLAQKEQKIKLILEEESKPHDFKANPMPSPTVCGLPARKKKASTRVHNFSFNTDSLALSKAFKWQKQMEDELMEQKRAMSFKANPCTVTTAEPFLPNKTMKPLTEFAEFKLHSETRASLRSKYNEELKQKEAEQEAQLEARRLKEEELAQQEIAALRAKTVHKANPVPHHQTFQVKHGLIPATNPVTPKFATDKRLKRKHE